MELLFNISSSAAFETDFKETLGFVDSDIPLRKIKPDLVTSARELQELIGKPTFDAIVANNAKNDSDNTKDQTLNSFAKYAIAIKAYLLFAPANDLSHSSNGRKQRSSEKEKMPFEWAIVKSDDDLQKRCYRALDTLIKYMDESFAVWKASDEYKKTHKLFVSTTEVFNKYYQIESRLLLLKLQPGIEMCETSKIKPRIGKEMFDDLKTRIHYFATTNIPEGEEPAQEELDDDELLLIERIQQACVYESLSWGLPRLQANLFPEGILQSVRGDRMTVKGRAVPAAMQVDQMAQLFQKDADAALLEIEAIYAELNPPATPVTLTEEQTSVIKFGFDDCDNFVNT